MSKLNFRKLAIILTLTVAVLLGACQGSTSGTTGDNGNIDKADDLTPVFPEADMGGKEITIALLNWYDYEPLAITDIAVEGFTGEGFNDSAFERNKFMEETFNCVINTVTFPHAETVMPQIRNQISAGDDSYDVILPRARWMLPLLTGGYLHDLSDFPHVDLNKPWWDGNSINAMSLGGKAYSLLGSHTMSVMSCVWLTYFNKDLTADFGLDDPYRLVREGKWTLEKMHEMGRQVAADLNNDGVRDVNDRFGVTHIIDATSSLMNSFGERLVDNGGDGLPYISLSKQSAIDKFMHIVEILSDHDTFINAQQRTNNPHKYEAGLFVAGQSLFSLGGVYYGAEMRQMEQEFGLLPYPKFDEKQTEWFNPINASALPLLTVPITNDDFENTGLFIEAFTYQGYTNIRPQFYEVLLQRKVARDNESEEMLDFIFNNIFLDIGVLYNFGNLSGSIDTMGARGDKNIVSHLESVSPAVNGEIQNFVDAIIGN